MKLDASRLSAAAAIAALSVTLASCSSAPTTDMPARSDSIPVALSKLDHALYDALNKCADSDELDFYGEFFDEDVEVFDGNKGLSKGRKAVVKDAKNNICGDWRRELVEGSLRTYPITDYGAVAVGRERYCQAKGPACNPAADFTIVWRKDGQSWRVTRILRYGQAPQG